MEKRLDLEQYVKDLEKHVDHQANDLVKARALLEKSLNMIDIIPNAMLWEDVAKLKDDIGDFLYGANRNYVNQD
tara:strand:+ start:5195 stop:5416 length:222 start_codon:yes stop_codon:yes gene_type:complete